MITTWVPLTKNLDAIRSGVSSPHIRETYTLCSQLRTTLFWFFGFTARQHNIASMQSAVLATTDCVRPSDRLPHAAIMPKRLKLGVGSWGFYWRIAP